MQIPGVLEFGGVSFRVGLAGEGEIVVVGEVVAFFEEVVLHVEKVVEDFVDFLIGLVVGEGLLGLEGHQTYVR